MKKRYVKEEELQTELSELRFNDYFITEVNKENRKNTYYITYNSNV